MNFILELVRIQRCCLHSFSFLTPLWWDCVINYPISHEELANSNWSRQASNKLPSKISEVLGKLSFMPVRCTANWLGNFINHTQGLVHETYFVPQWLTHSNWTNKLTQGSFSYPMKFYARRIVSAEIDTTVALSQGPGCLVIEPYGPWADGASLKFLPYELLMVR